MAVPSNILTRPEHRLILCCARTSLSREQIDLIQTLPRQQFDWSYLLNEAQRHGVLPLLYQNLSRCGIDHLPTDVLSHLRSQHLLSVQRSLTLTGETLQLLKSFESKGIIALLYKGPELAMRAYGNLALRPYNDIDVLVRSSDLPAVWEHLEQKGYSPEQPFSIAQKPWYRSITSEMTFVSPERHGAVDLHWALSPPYFAFNLNTDDVWNRRIPSVLDPSAFTLCPEDLLLALCSHNTKHSWSRLEWICSIAEIVRRDRTQSFIDWQYLFRSADQLGGRRMLEVGLALSNALLDFPSDGRPSKNEIQTDSEVKNLCLQIWQRMFVSEDKDVAPGLFPDSAAKPIKAMSFHLKSRERLSDRINYRLKFWRAYWRDLILPRPDDVASIALPKRLKSLYVLVRMVRLTKKYAVRAMDMKS